jgi:hypothetical protein
MQPPYYTLLFLSPLIGCLSLFPDPFSKSRQTRSRRVAMNEESSDPIAYIERDAFSHHPSNPFELPVDDASSDPMLLTPSKRKAKRKKPQEWATKEEEDVMRTQERPGPDPDATVIPQIVTPRDTTEANADLDETQVVEQAMESEYIEDETMEDYDEPVGDHELSEGDFRERTSDEHLTLNLKSPEEQAEIDEEIEDLLQKVPQLADDYELLDRLGTGVADSLYVTRSLRSDYLCLRNFLCRIQSY